jgi:hypothetical protein
MRGPSYARRCWKLAGVFTSTLLAHLGDSSIESIALSMASFLDLRAYIENHTLENGRWKGLAQLTLYGA